MIKINENYIDTYITSDDKISLSKLKASINNYPVSTYIRYSTKGSINAINSNTYGLLKVGVNQWSPYSSLVGVDKSKVMTSDEIIGTLTSKGVKNIGVKIQ